MCSQLLLYNTWPPDSADPNVVVMDRQEFEGSAYQRVYQYMHRNAAGLSLERFFYTLGSVEGDCTECLDIILRYVSHPSI